MDADLRLKKLEIYGFKSFADRVEMRFDQGVTGIVGPNGCGKSNIDVYKRQVWTSNLPYLVQKDDPYDYENTASVKKSYTFRRDFSANSLPDSVEDAMRSAVAAEFTKNGLSTCLLYTSLGIEPEIRFLIGLIGILPAVEAIGQADFRQLVVLGLAGGTQIRNQPIRCV